MYLQVTSSSISKYHFRHPLLRKILIFLNSYLTKCRLVQYYTKLVSQLKYLAITHPIFYNLTIHQTPHQRKDDGHVLPG
jgi:hypothetical protein